MELPPEASNNIYEMTEAERAAAGIDSLPEDLYQAIKEFEKSELRARGPGRPRLRLPHPQQVGGVGRVQEPSSPPTSSTATSPSSRQPPCCAPGGR